MFGCLSDRFAVFTADDGKVLEMGELIRSHERWTCLVDTEGPPFSYFLLHGPNGCFLCMSICLCPRD